MANTFLTPPASPEAPRWATPSASSARLATPGGGYSARRNLPKGELSVTPTLSPLSQFTSILSPLLGSLIPSPVVPFDPAKRSPPTPARPRTPNGFASAVEQEKVSAPPSPSGLHAGPAGRRGRTRTRTRARRLLLIGIVILAFGSVINNFLSSAFQVLSRQRKRYRALKTANGPGSKEYVRTGRHPIRQRLEHAHTRWMNMLKQQSTDAEDAAAEYHSRYGRDPPDGFAEWFDFAREAGVQLPDEYDSLMDSLEPFWALAPSELRRRTRELAVLPSFSLITVTTQEAVAVASPEWDATATLGRMLATQLHRLVGKPGIGEMAFAVNEADVPRVILPYEEAERLAHILQHGPNATLPQRAARPDWPNPQWEGDGSVWTSFVRACPPNSPARRAFTTLSTGLQSSRNLESGRAEWLVSHNVAVGSRLANRRPRGRRRFVAPVESGKAPAASLFEALDDRSFAFPEREGFVDPLEELCYSPALHDQHGLFFSDFRTLDELYPVFSTATVPGFADILIPPMPLLAPPDPEDPNLRHQRARQDHFGRWQATPEADHPWEARESRFYWRGEPTGETETPPGYELNFARPRLVRKTSTTTEGVTEDVVAHTTQGRQLAVVRSQLAALNARTANVALTGLKGCGSARACATIEGGEGYAFANPETAAQGMKKAKVVVDVDGEGQSVTRMAQILDAGAVPLRGTIFRDAFSDQILPWVHYIPLSPDFRELYHLHAYFLGPAVDTTSSYPTRNQPGELQTAKLKRGAQHEGVYALRRINRAGMEWRRRHTRPIDTEVYVYRLALEWSRLWSRSDEEFWIFSSLY